MTDEKIKQSYVDLDELVAETKVKLGGEEYIFKDITPRKQIQIMKIFKELQAHPDDVEQDATCKATSDLFQPDYPDRTPDWVKDNMTLKQIIRLFSLVVELAGGGAPKNEVSSPEK